jgi:hypothetical protein
LEVGRGRGPGTGAVGEAGPVLEWNTARAPRRRGFLSGRIEAPGGGGGGAGSLATVGTSDIKGVWVTEATGWLGNRVQKRRGERTEGRTSRGDNGVAYKTWPSLPAKLRRTEHSLG